MTALANRIGIDLGGTKIEGLALNGDNRVAAGPLRTPTPREDYAGTLDAIADLVAQLDQKLAPENRATVGVAMPGSIAKTNGRVQNANSTWLNDRPLGLDLEVRLGRPVRLANDANCFALSEAIDGAAAGADSVFGVILGTGCGGGLVIGDRLIDGPRGIAGEWGHNPLPWPRPDEHPGPRCWCGRRGCMETWVSGPALEADHAGSTGTALKAARIAEAARGGDATAAATISRHVDRLGRGLAHVINVFDPDVIVLGGGLSNLDHLYADLPGAVTPHLFTSQPFVDIRRPRWGDSSGVRGAAWLWNDAGPATG